MIVSHDFALETLTQFEVSPAKRSERLEFALRAIPVRLSEGLGACGRCPNRGRNTSHWRAVDWPDLARTVSVTFAVQSCVGTVLAWGCGDGSRAAVGLVPDGAGGHDRHG